MKDMANPNDTPLTNAEAMEAAVCIKRLHALAEKTGDQGMIKRVAVLHEAMKRYGEGNHGEITVMSGGT